MLSRLSGGNGPLRRSPWGYEPCDLLLSLGFRGPATGVICRARLKGGETERGVLAFACQYIVSPRGRTGNRTVTQTRHPLLVEGRPNCARQSLASALSAPRVAATSYCDPGRHADVVTPCLLTPVFERALKIWALRAQSWKKSLKTSSRALPAPVPRKSETESKKSQKRLFFNYFDSFSTPFSTWARAGRRQELIFGLFFQLWARRAQRTPLAGKGFRNAILRCRGAEG